MRKDHLKMVKKDIGILLDIGARMSIPKADLSHEKPTSPLTSNVISKSLFWKVPVDRQRFISSIGFQKQPLHVMASQNTSVATSADTSDKNSSGPLQKNVQQSTFPIAFQALVEDVCEQTQIAELKLKIGDFEMFLKRDIGISSAPSPVYAPVESSITAPPILSEPMEETATSPTPFLEQVSTEETSSPFVNISAAKTLKLASLEASGHDAFVIVASPLNCFTMYLSYHYFPLQSDVDGEVLKILYEDGEAVGYGDPLVAVLPSFHAIN
ncbi:hypothetical protein ZIOFF_009394 [Zingiber officinale]|uniref:Biotin carboxyl carrier protein n=1 Tax=Zingiber officinale TaxID=94328 RepID=A0A8J5LJC8_ZINOF|nr:hypothetical protein ZIOFF_009394 [Zingiber officinale]